MLMSFIDSSKCTVIVVQYYKYATVAQISQTVNMKKYVELCRKDSESGYVVDNTLEIKRKTIKQATDSVFEKATHIMADLIREKGVKVKHYYIGKTYIRRKDNSEVKFNASDSTTWKTEGISSRYYEHRKEKYGQDGLIVLAVVTHDSIPEGCRCRRVATL
jgi:hypothetical protein